MSDIDRFDTYEFESIAAQNGTLTWHEDRLMAMLGYEDKQSFRKAVMRAMSVCITLEIAPHADFIPLGQSYKFTRVACYLIAMNADPKKPRVAMAQAYFAGLANIIDTRHDHVSRVDRVAIREELTGGIKSLAKTADQHGVESYGRFMDAGYRGMYNMGLADLARMKGVSPGEKLIDRMDRTELAANLFRLTQTDSKIQNEGVQGQVALEDAAHEVGEAVRDTMIKISGTRPENLPITEHIRDAKKKIKSTRRKMEKLSTPKEHEELLFVAVKEEHTEDPADPGFTPDPEEQPPSSTE